MSIRNKLYSYIEVDAFLLLYSDQCVNPVMLNSYINVQESSHIRIYINSTKNVDFNTIRDCQSYFKLNRKNLRARKNREEGNEHGVCSTSLVFRDYSDSTT